MTRLTNRSNLRTNLRIDSKKKIWGDDTLNKHLNEGQRWLIDDPAVDWSFQEAVGYLVPVKGYNEYRASNDGLPEQFFSENIKKITSARVLGGANLSFGSFVNNFNVLSSPSEMNEYANRYLFNAGFSNDSTYTTIHNMDSFDGNGTWVELGDTTNIATDNSTYKEGSGSVSFDADVSVSTDNRVALSNSSFSSVDLSSYDLNKSGLIFWVYFPSVTNMKSVEVKLGNDSSNYFKAKQYETDVQGNKYQSGWTRIFIPTVNRAEYGTIDLSAIDYAQISIIFDASQTDITGFRIDNLQIVDQYLEYKHLRRSEDMANDSDESTVPSRYQHVYELYAEYKAWRTLRGAENKANLTLQEAELAKNTMIEELQWNMPHEFNMPNRT